MILKQNCAKLTVLPHNIFLEDKKAISANFAKTPPFLYFSYYPLGTLYLFQQTKILFLQGRKEEQISPFDIHHTMLQFSEIFKRRSVTEGPHRLLQFSFPALTTLEPTPTDKVGLSSSKGVWMFCIFPHKFLYLLKYLNILDKMKSLILLIFKHILVSKIVFNGIYSTACIF